MTLERTKQNNVDRIVEDALDRFCQDADTLVAGGQMSEEEVTEALVGSPDFGDAWDDYLYESRADEEEEKAND